MKRNTSIGNTQALPVDKEEKTMSAEYMHIGIPITNRKPNMVYNEGAKFWVSCVDDYDYKIEYLKFEEGTPFPEDITIFLLSVLFLLYVRYSIIIFVRYPLHFLANFI